MYVIYIYKSLLSWDSKTVKLTFEICYQPNIPIFGEDRNEGGVHVRGCRYKHTLQQHILYRFSQMHFL